MTAHDDRLGPVDYLVVRLPKTPTTAGFTALLGAIDAGQIRLLDLEILRREDAGTLLVETAAWGAQVGVDLSEFDGATSQLLDDEDREILAAQLAVGESALVIVYEPLVIDPVVAAFVAAGGAVLDEGPIDDAPLLAALDTPEEVQS